MVYFIWNLRNWLRGLITTHLKSIKQYIEKCRFSAQGYLFGAQVEKYEYKVTNIMLTIEMCFPFL